MDDAKLPTPEISRIDWYEDDSVTDPYNRYKGRIPEYPEWEVKQNWDGSRDTMGVLHNGMHVGYVRYGDLTELREFITSNPAF